MKMGIAMVNLGSVMLVLGLAGPVLAATWLGSTTNWNDTANWSGGAVPGNGDDVVIPNLAIDPVMPAGTYPATGSFASFELQAGASNTCLGDTNEINESSGGTVAVPHGIGVTINVSGDTTIAGTLSAASRGFPADSGPGGSSANYGGSYGGVGMAALNTFAGFGKIYGSITNPTALGSGGDGGAGGGAVKLDIGGTLTLNGTITADGTDSGTAGGSGGSISLTCAAFAGTGLVSAQGGDGHTSIGRNGGGGRISIDCNSKTFSGTITAAGGYAPTVKAFAQPGTLWYPRMFEGLEGSAGSPVNITITNSLQYFFANTVPTYYWNLTLSNVWAEFYDGSLSIGNLTLTNASVLTFDNTFCGTRGGYTMNSLTVTGSLQVSGSIFWMPPQGNYDLSGDFTLEAASTNYCLSDTNAINEASGGTVAVPHGSGVTINVGGNATIAGLLYGQELGFTNSTGPGVGGGASHGGYGVGGVATYGSMTQPTALGSGGSGSNPKNGGSAIKLKVDGTLHIDGTINMNGGQHRNCGSGGSIWLIADTFEGGGIISADGGSTTDGTGAAGGGRVAITYNTSTFSGTVSAAGGRNNTIGSWGQPGTLWEPKKFAGLEGAPGSPADITITTGYQYFFTNASLTTYYWNLTIVGEGKFYTPFSASLPWIGGGIEFHNGDLVITDLTLTNQTVLRFDLNRGGGAAFDMASLTIGGSIKVYSNSYLYLPPQGAYELAGNLYVQTNNGTLYCQGHTGVVNEASGGTEAVPHGTGVTMTVSGNVTIDAGGMISAQGFPLQKGPGVLASGYYGGSHGGKGGANTKIPYGRLVPPTALGSGGYGSAGGGALALCVEGILTVNGSLSAQGDANSYRTGSGGSLIVSCRDLQGVGTISAAGGTVTTPANSNARGGGGGRLVLEYETSTFTGSVLVDTTPCSSGGYTGETGTLFQCVSPYRRTFCGGYNGIALASDFAVASNNVKIVRGITRWSAKTLAWTEKSTDVAGASLTNTASYTLTGLTPQVRYCMYTNDVSMFSGRSSAAGSLTISNIALSGTTNVIRVEIPTGGTVFSMW